MLRSSHVAFCALLGVRAPPTRFPFFDHPAGAAACHFVMEAADPHSGVRVARTLFLSQAGVSTPGLSFSCLCLYFGCNGGSGIGEWGNMACVSAQ